LGDFKFIKQSTLDFTGIRSIVNDDVDVIGRLSDIFCRVSIVKLSVGAFEENDLLIFSCKKETTEKETN
jgi:hypothetical protein